MSQSFNESAFLGVKGVASKAIEKEIRVLSTREVYALTEHFSKRTGLSRTQFAVNGWGFPFIPVPEVRVAYNNIRTAPRNVIASFFGHPIYWIDPELTKRRDGEGEQEWCIRMFFLIDGMGYWTKNVEFIDFLKVNDFSFDPKQIETYHRIADQGCETDDYYLLDESSLDFPLEQVEKNYINAKKRMFLIQEQESREMLKSQARQYEFARKAIGPHSRKWSTSYSDSSGIWARKFVPALGDIATEYNRRYREGDQMVSDLQKRARNISDTLTDVISRYNHATSVLEIPVKSSIKGRPGGSARISYLATSMSAANQRDNLRKTLLDPIEKGMRSAFASGNAGEGGFDPVIRAMEDVYSISWNRLRLALVNYDSLRNGEELFSSIVELQSALQSVSTDGRLTAGSGLSSILDKDFS